MKTAIVATALLLVAAGTTTADTQQRPTRGGLTIDQWRKSANTHARWVRKLRQANRQRWTPTLERGIQLAAIAYQQPAGAMYRVAWCESRMHLYARSDGGHLGPFQFAPSTWATTPYARFSPFDPTAAPLAAAWMWKQGRRREWACR